MLKKFISICALALSIVIFMSPAAQAGDCGCDSLGHKMHEAMEKLHLTPEQQDKIKAIHGKAHEIIKAKHDEMHTLRMTIHDAFKNGSMTAEKVDAFANQKIQIVGAIIKTHMMERFEMSKVLNDEQRQKLHDMVKDKMEHHPKSCH